MYFIYIAWHILDTQLSSCYNKTGFYSLEFFSTVLKHIGHLQHHDPGKKITFLGMDSP